MLRLCRSTLRILNTSSSFSYPSPPQPLFPTTTQRNLGKHGLLAVPRHPSLMRGIGTRCSATPLPNPLHGARGKGAWSNPGLHVEEAARPSPLIPYALTRLGDCHRGVGRRNPSWSLPRSGATWPRPGKNPRRDHVAWKKGGGFRLRLRVYCRL